MKILFQHADYIEYKPIKKEIKNAEEAEKETVRYEEIIVLFLSVETGDNNQICNKTVNELQISLDRLKINRVLIYPYAHLSDKLAKPLDAITIIKLLENEVKKIGVEVYRSPFGWNKTFTIKVKGHPLAEQFKSITKDTKTDNVSSALKMEDKLESKYYIIDKNGKMDSISEYNFTNQEKLSKFVKYETTKSRVVNQIPPHVELMKRLEIADYEPGSDPGNLRFYPKGRLIKSLLERYVTEKVIEYGGMEVETPIMYDYNHPSLSDYLNRFPARQYTIKSEDKDLFLRFSACFGQFLMASDAQFSYKQTPLKFYELTRYSFRREKRGELVGLRRLRAFTMPDCHALCSDLDQAKDEFIKRLKLSIEVLEKIGLDKDDYIMALRFTDDFYNKNKIFIESIIKILGRSAFVEIWDKRFFYFTLKWELNFIDNLDKASALSTDQIDVENGKRYNITFTDKNGDRKNPIILHCSPSGAIERNIYAILEKEYAKQKNGVAPNIPFWLAPTQIRLIPMSTKFIDYSNQLSLEINKKKIRNDIDDREISVSKKIRDAGREWIRYVIVIGEKEIQSDKLPVRDRKSNKLRNITLEDLIKEIITQVKDLPTQSLAENKLLSLRSKFS